MQFKDIPGLQDTKKTLVNAVKSGHIAHAQLFSGNEGSANLALALAYATLINCERPNEDDSCGECPSCQKNNKLIHPDLHFVYPVSNTKSVSGKDAVSTTFLPEWRKFVKENVYASTDIWSITFGGEGKQLNISKEESRNIIRDLSLTSFDGKYKFMVIWQPEYLHPSAANAILKILEEPPERTVFLLVTNDYRKLLSTIISRTQMFVIPGFSRQDVSNVLVQEYQVEQDKAISLAHLADGNMHKAIQLSKEVENNSHELFQNWMRLCYKFDIQSMVSEADVFSKLNKTGQKSMFQYGLNILRETIVHTHCEKMPIKLDGKEAEFVRNFSKVLTFDKINMLSEEFNNSIYHLERNANAKILFLDTSLKASNILRMK